MSHTKSADSRIQTGVDLRHLVVFAASPQSLKIGCPDRSLRVAFHIEPDVKNCHSEDAEGSGQDLDRGLKIVSQSFVVHSNVPKDLKADDPWVVGREKEGSRCDRERDVPLATTLAP